MPVPDVDPAARQLGRRLQRVLIAHADGERGRALVETVLVGDAPQADAPDLGHATEESRGQHALVGADRAEAGHDRVAPFRAGGVAVGASDVGEVVDRGDHAGEALVVLGPRLPALGSLVGRRAQLVRCPRVEQLAAHAQHPQVRSEELVRRARHDVRVEPMEVERAVLGEVHAVDGRERSGRVDPSDQIGGGGIVPTAFDARVNATSRVRSLNAASNESRSSVTSSSRISTQRTVAPASSAASTHGRTFAS